MNGQQALDIVRENVLVENNGERCGFDLIFMDCNMPIMDGYEATDKIREFLYIQGIVQPLIVAVTGHSEQLYVDKAINSGINYVL